MVDGLPADPHAHIIIAAAPGLNHPTGLEVAVEGVEPPAHETPWRDGLSLRTALALRTRESNAAVVAHLQQMHPSAL